MLEKKEKLNISISFSLKGLMHRINLFYVLIKKTFFFDLYTHWKSLFSVLFIIIIPSLMLIFFPPQLINDQTSLNELLGMIQVIFSYCVAFASILIYSSASLIADEIKYNTMILLTTKPISKGSIVWGKYFALLFYGIVVSIVSLGILCLIAFLKHPFSDMGSFFVSQFLFSLIIIFFYSTFTIGFSMIFRNAKTAALIPLTFSMITIFLFFIIRPMLMSPTPSGMPYYEVFQIFYFDLGYHLMNIYTWFYETFISTLSITLIRWLVSWGIYIIEYDELFPEIEIYTRTNYLPPQASLLIILLFVTILMLIGYIIFRRRDIN